MISTREQYERAKANGLDVSFNTFKEAMIGYRDLELERAKKYIEDHRQEIETEETLTSELGIWLLNNYRKSANRTMTVDEVMDAYGRGRATKNTFGRRMTSIFGDSFVRNKIRCYAIEKIQR
jgi:hypothetical protein